MRKVTISVGPYQWLDAGPLGVLMDVRKFAEPLRQPWDAYRKALSNYEDALKATEGGTKRQQEATRAWNREIDRLVAKDRSVEDIFEIVGAEPVWMPNKFVLRVCTSCKEVAEQRQAELARLLAKHYDDIMEYLDSLDPSTGRGGSLGTEGVRHQIAAAKAVMEGLAVNA